MKQYQSIIILTTLVLLNGCSSSHSENEKNASSPDIIVCGLYYSQDKEGAYSVMKVLAVDDVIVHVRNYANKFTEKPADVDPEVLTLGGLNDPAGIGIGHFPVAKEGFLKENPVFIKQIPVTEEELEGYRMYLEAMQGAN